MLCQNEDRRGEQELAECKSTCCKVLVNNPRQYEYGHKKRKWSSATERNKTAQTLENMAGKWTVLKVLSIWKVLGFVEL